MRKISFLLVLPVLFVLASPALAQTATPANWTYTINFDDSDYCASLIWGEYGFQDYVGGDALLFSDFQPDYQSYLLQGSIAFSREITASYVQLNFDMVAPTPPDDAVLSGNFHAFGMTQSVTSVALGGDAWGVLMRPAYAGQSGSSLNFAVQVFANPASLPAGAKPALRSITIGGTGENPFAYYNPLCVDGAQVTPSPFPTSTTAPPTATRTPSPTITPTPSNTPTPTDTPPVCEWEYTVPVNNSEVFASYNCYQGQCRITYIQTGWINFSVATHLTHFEVNGSFTYGANTGDQNWKSYLHANTGTSGSGTYIFNQNYEMANRSTQPPIAANVNWNNVRSFRWHRGLGSHFNGSATADGSGTIESVYFEGTGVNPFTGVECGGDPTATPTASATASATPSRTPNPNNPTPLPFTPNQATSTSPPTSTRQPIQWYTPPPLGTLPPPPTGVTPSSTPTIYYVEGHDETIDGLGGIAGALLAAGGNAMGQAFDYAGQLYGTVTGVVSGWANATPTPIEGLPRCATSPMSSQLCAIYYILDNTILSGTLGSLIIPLGVAVLNLWLLLVFVKLVRAILARIAKVVEV